MIRLASFLLLSAWAGLSSAEILPTSGTFRGVYHEDRWGEGSLRFFRFRDQGLRRQLAPYEGTHISLEVVRGAREWTTKHPVTVYEIGKVETLAPPILHMKVRCIPEHPRPSTPFVVWVELWNTGDRPVIVTANDVTVYLVVAHRRNTDKHFRKAEDLIQDFEAGKSRWMRRGEGGVLKVYSQRSYLRFGFQVDTLADWGSRMTTVAKCKIPPGEYVPFAKRFARGFLPGEYEIRASGPPDAPGQEPNRENYAWTTLDVAEDNKEKTEEPAALRIVEKSLQKSDDAYHLRIHVAPRGDKAVRIPLGQSGRWLAGLWAYDSHSNAVELKMERQLWLNGLYEWNDVWQFVEVPRDGLVLERTFWPEREYTRPNQRRELAKVSLEFLTDRGAQSINISVDESKLEERAP